MARVGIEPIGTDASAHDLVAIARGFGCHGLRAASGRGRGARGGGADGRPADADRGASVSIGAVAAGHPAEVDAGLRELTGRQRRRCGDRSRFRCVRRRAHQLRPRRLRPPVRLPSRSGTIPDRRPRAPRTDGRPAGHVRAGRRLCGWPLRLAAGGRPAQRAGRSGGSGAGGGGRSVHRPRRGRTPAVGGDARAGHRVGRRGRRVRLAPAADDPRAVTGDPGHAGRRRGVPANGDPPPGSGYWGGGERLDTAALASTLRRIARRDGAAGFHGGAAAAIERAVAAGGGILTAADLTGYRPKLLWEPPRRYRDLEYVTSNDQVGYEGANILERFSRWAATPAAAPSCT